MIRKRSYRVSKTFEMDRFKIIKINCIDFIIYIIINFNFIFV